MSQVQYFCHAYRHLDEDGAIDDLPNNYDDNCADTIISIILATTDTTEIGL